MGEAKRRRMSGADFRKLTTEVTKRLTDEGKLIEAGWVGLRDFVISKDASDVQLAEMRMAFFAGAQHVFSSMMTFMEEGTEPTDADLRRMDHLHAELERFRVEFEGRIAQAAPTKGNA